MTESCRLITTEQYQEYQLLKKKLDIAVDYLKYIADQDDWNEDLAHCAENALQEIKEVK